MAKVIKYNGIVGTINGVEFYDQAQLNTLEYLLGVVEKHYGDVYNKDFVSDLANVCETIYLKYDDISYGDIEKEFTYCIEKCGEMDGVEFSHIDFKIEGDDWKFEWFNRNLHKREYLKSDSDKEDDEPSEGDIYTYSVSSVVEGNHNLRLFNTPELALQHIINDLLANSRIHDRLIDCDIPLPTVNSIGESLKDNGEFNLCHEHLYDVEANIVVYGSSLDDSQLSVDVYDHSRDFQDSWAVHVLVLNTKQN